MFNFFKGAGKTRELDAIIDRIELNAANNYKDEAQRALKELESRIEELVKEGSLSDKKAKEYSGIVTRYKEKMKGYTHKDQPTGW